MAAAYRNNSSIVVTILVNVIPTQERISEYRTATESQKHNTRQYRIV